MLKKQKAAGGEEVKERMRSLIEWNKKSATRKKSRKVQTLAYLVN
jgi:catabolite regulation protein CreA